MSTIAQVPARIPPILILGDHFGYPGGVPHGVTTYFLNVLPALKAAGLDLTVCFLREPHPAAEPLRRYGIEPIFLAASKWDPTVVLRVAALARRRGVRLIHSTGIKGTLVARIAARLCGARHILHVHDLNDPGDVVSSLQRMFARPTDLAVCVSRAVRELTVRRYHVAEDRLRVIHNGIRLDELRNAGPDTRARVRGQLGLPSDAIVAALVGRMHPVKGHRAMLEMMPGILRELPGLVLMLVGDGPERPACEALVERLGLGTQVRFLGQRNDIPNLLQCADVVVMPSRSEGLGLAAIEALAAGKPVIAFGVGGLREVVQDHVNGRLVPAGNDGAFVDALVETIRDRKRLQEYARQAVSASLRFTIDEHIRKLINCYGEAVGQAAMAKRGVAPEIEL